MVLRVCVDDAVGVDAATEAVPPPGAFRFLDWDCEPFSATTEKLDVPGICSFVVGVAVPAAFTAVVPLTADLLP